MKKGSLALRLFLYISLFSLVWLGSYITLSGAFAVQEPSKEPPKEQEPSAAYLPDTLSSYWSVLAVTDGERKVAAFFLRYADFLNDTLVFVEVPVDTKAELSGGGYEVLSVHNPELPELFMLSELCSFFSEETLCMAAQEVGASFLGVRPKTCYILEKAAFEELTERTKDGIRFALKDSVKDTIVKVTERALTDRSLKEEMVYLESYLDVKRVIYRRLPGKAEAQEYRPDAAGIREMVEAYQTGLFTEKND